MGANTTYLAEVAAHCAEVSQDKALSYLRGACSVKGNADTQKALLQMRDNLAPVPASDLPPIPVDKRRKKKADTGVDPFFDACWDNSEFLKVDTVDNEKESLKKKAKPRDVRRRR